MKSACLGKRSCWKQGIEHQTKLTFKGMVLFKMGSRCEMRDQALRTWQSSISHMTLWPNTLHCQAWGTLISLGSSSYAWQLSEWVIFMWMDNDWDARRATVGWVSVAQLPCLGGVELPGWQGHLDTSFLLWPLLADVSTLYDLEVLVEFTLFLKTRKRRWERLNNLFMSHLTDRSRLGPGLDLFSQSDRVGFLRACIFVDFWLSTGPDKGLHSGPGFECCVSCAHWTLNQEHSSRGMGCGGGWGRWGFFRSVHTWVRCLFWFVGKQDWHLAGHNILFQEYQ